MKIRGIKFLKQPSLQRQDKILQKLSQNKINSLILPPTQIIIKLIRQNKVNLHLNR